MIRKRAEEKFRKKEERAQEGAKAMTEYEAASRALLEKTERLRTLRLAKEAAEREAKRESGTPLRPRRRKSVASAK
jgi:hypothetical protein